MRRTEPPLDRPDLEYHGGVVKEPTVDAILGAPSPIGFLDEAWQHLDIASRRTFQRALTAAARSARRERVLWGLGYVGVMVLIFCVLFGVLAAVATALSSFLPFGLAFVLSMSLFLLLKWLVSTHPRIEAALEALQHSRSFWGARADLLEQLANSAAAKLGTPAA